MLIAGQWILPPAVVVTLGLFECVLGWLVIAFIPSRRLSIVVVSVFVLFVGVLALQANAGLQRCSCLGSSGLPVNTVLVFDVFAVCSCMWLREHWCQPLRISSDMVADLIGGIKFAVPAALVAALGWFGSLEAASDFIAGSPLRVNSREQFLGQVEPNTEIVTTFSLRNTAAESIRILGAKSSCRCFAVKDLPLELAAGEEKQIRISLYSQSDAGSQRESAMLIFSRSAPRIVLGATVLVHPGRDQQDAKLKREKSGD
ncbi:hypothetical protein CA13_52460 [Planctomycetes bacterium CA13]|uniref:DUF1573 domain-containing protein n=1 Tax=Novipirellula herctigrandis TaxID=2527986 RepID=A0A5C5Z994_9BACT|nr:hypothetical protein CA13_52460 [Planctomycetes bacterium CA13]